MFKTKLTVRVDKDSLELAKQYAAAHNTSLSRLVSEFLRSLPAEGESGARPPILLRLSGVLPLAASAEEHHAFLDEKYGS